MSITRPSFPNREVLTDLEVDGSTAVVDEVNNRLGVNTSSPAATLDVAGDVRLSGDIVVDDGGSLKEAGGTAAITFDGSGHVTKIGQDSMSSGDVLTWDGAKFVGEAPTTGDITGVTAGNGLSGGGSSGGVSLALDLNGLSAAAVNVANDSIVIVDADDSNANKKESIADLATAMAGTGLSASSGQLTVDSITSVGTISTGTWQGTAIAQAYIANDAINGDKIADDAINSEHYTNGSIDTDHIGDDQVTLAKMAGLARGKIIVGDASGDPSALAVGSENQVLTVDSNGDAVWANASGGGMSNFILEDGDGTEVAVSDGKEIKFVEGGGIDIDWTDTSTGSDGDPFDLTFTVNSSGTATAMVTGGNLTAVDAAQQIIAAQVFS